MRPRNTYDCGDVGCPDPETLELLFGGGLTTEQRASIADHAATCRDCRDLIDALIESSVPRVTVGSMGVPAAAEVFGLGHGARVDRYVIEKRIGQGGMGVVYAARDPELGRGIAIKMLRAGAPAERLRREAQALARLSHPNVVAVHDVGEHEGKTFIAMALVDGDNLRRWLDTPRSADDIMRVLLAAGRGIAAAHAAGMIHRDLKPDNIFVARDGEVLVGDFGLARETVSGDPTAVGLMDSESDLTVTGTILGTPAYMAPEQMSGDATEASDQFSFCVTAWEALYGARPFPGRAVADLRAQIAAGELGVPSDDRGVPSRVTAALRRGLAPEPGARFPSMTVLLRELAPRRRRWPWFAAGIAALGAVAVVAALGLRHQGASCDTGHLLDGVWPQPTSLSPRTVAALDTYAAHWLAMRNELCVTRDELGAVVADARLACLEQRRGELGVVVATFGRSIDGASSRRAVDTLRPIEDCVHAVLGQPQRPDLAIKIAKLEADYAANRRATVDAVRALVGEADQAGADEPLVAALVLEATYERDAQRLDKAEILLRRALTVAERSRDDLGRVHVSVALADVLVRLRRLLDAHNVLDQAAAILARVGPSREHELELSLARVAVLAEEGDHRAAAQLVREYVSVREQQANLTEIAAGYLLLGRELAASGDASGAAAAYRKLAAAEQEVSNEPGPTAVALGAQAMAAQTAGDFDRAIELDERALAYVRSVPHGDADEVYALSALVGSYNMAGAWSRMREAAEAQLALMPDTVENRGLRADATENIGFARFYSTGPATAIESLRKAIELENQIGSDDTNAQILLATALVDTGKYREARVMLEKQLPVLATADPPRPWRHGTAAYSLARALWEDGDEHDRGRARALAADADNDLVVGIDELSKFPAAAASVRIITDRLAALRAWRQRHP